ncbi:MAG: hemerythrin domain-containing protein [Pseudomonadota bacterium]
MPVENTKSSSASTSQPARGKSQGNPANYEGDRDSERDAPNASKSQDNNQRDREEAEGQRNTQAQGRKDNGREADTRGQTDTQRGSRRNTKGQSDGEDQSDSDGVLVKLGVDHREVRGLFSDYETLVRDEASASDRRSCAEHIFSTLMMHAAIEEEIFYPAMRKIARDPQQIMVMAEAEVEHATVKDLIAQLQNMDPEEALYDARVKVLGEYVAHHVREEESDMFQMAEESDLDLEELGERVQARKEELMESTTQEGAH